MGLLAEEREMFPKETKPKQYRTVKMIFENDFDKSINEITLKSEYVDGVSLNDLMNTFRQFVLAIGYTEDTARTILSLNADEVADLGLSMSDLDIVEYKTN